MRFKCLRIENYRGIPELDVGFEPDMTVIAGGNGSGKTVMLDALAMIMNSAFVDAAQPLDKTRVEAGESAGCAGFARLTLLRDDHGDASDSLAGKHASGEKRLSIKISSQTGTALDGSPRFEGEDNFHSLECMKTLVVHYPQGRGFDLARPRWVKSITPGASGLPDSIQRRSLAQDSRPADELSAWWNQRHEEQERRRRGDPDCQDRQLTSVAEAVGQTEGFLGVAFDLDAEPKGLHFIKANGASVHVDNLSGGERAYALLVADLAHRLQVVAPGKPVGETPAIVMIDEVEASLHPRWQSEIVPTLQKVFPSCQFILTTHSPQVLSCVDSRMTRVIEEDESGLSRGIARPYSTRGQTSNFLLEAVFGASEREPAANAAIQRFNDAIDNKDVEEGERALKDVEDRIGDDAPTLLILGRRLNRLRGGETRG